MNGFQNIKNCRLCSNKVSFFDALTDEEMVAISAQRVEVKYKAGETIFKQGSSLTHILMVATGMAKMYLENNNERNLTLKYIRPKDFLIWPGIFTDKRHHFSVSAVEDTIACMLDINLFCDFLKQNNDFALGYIKFLSENSIYYFEKILSLTQKHMHGRIAEALIYIHDKQKLNNGQLFPVNKQELALLTDITKDSVGRILKEFHEGGIIEMDKLGVKIMKFDMLKQISVYG